MLLSCHSCEDSYPVGSRQAALQAAWDDMTCGVEAFVAFFGIEALGRV